MNESGTILYLTKRQICFHILGKYRDTVMLFVSKGDRLVTPITFVPDDVFDKIIALIANSDAETYFREEYDLEEIQ